MGNSQTFPHTTQEIKDQLYVTDPKKIRVRIGFMCFDFVPCSHFVEIEGIDGWVAYEAPMIMKCFLKNGKHFAIDSKFMPELGIERPDITHFEWYKNLTPIDPNEVIEMHKRALVTGSLVSVSHT